MDTYDKLITLIAAQFWIDTLRRLVRMPADMVGPDNGDRLPVNLGPVAENMMLAAGASAEGGVGIVLWSHNGQNASCSRRTSRT